MIWARRKFWLLDDDTRNSRILDGFRKGHPEEDQMVVVSLRPNNVVSYLLDLLIDLNGTAYVYVYVYSSQSL